MSACGPESQRHRLAVKDLADGRHLPLRRSAEEAVPIAAAEEKDDDPADIPAAETAYAVMFEAAVVASAVAATAAQDQDEEDQIGTAASPCLALTSTPTVCCRYITHVDSSKKFSLHSIICGAACHSFLWTNRKFLQILWWLVIL